MTAQVRLATGRYMLAVVRGERQLPPAGVPFAYDLNRWVFVEVPGGGMTARLELTNDEEREVTDWIVARRTGRTPA